MDEERAEYRFQQGEDGVFRSYLVRRGSKDGRGAGDNDAPFEGFQPSHFGLRQMSRLLVLRSRVLEAKEGQGGLADDLAAS
ncbi:MAG: hypothetical protein HY690_05910 [Chloroflexi bacterium]|nr:hypothetical protein [Chloroflexota bacterium]